MSGAKTGDIVKVHYTGTLEDGEVFDSTKDRGPMDVTLGAHQVIQGFEDALMGMEKGDKKTVTIPSAEAYGAYSDQHFIEAKLSDLPQDPVPAIGTQLQATDQNGQVFIAVIKEIEGDMAKIDMNHPMAGKDLTFKLELFDIVGD